MEQIEKIVVGIIKFLKVSGRLDWLPQIIQQLEKEALKLRGENTAIVSSAQPLTKDELTEIEKQLIHLFGKRLNLINKIDPLVIGGFVIQVFDKVVDLSLNNYLSLLEEKIRNETN